MAVGPVTRTLKSHAQPRIFPKPATELFAVLSSSQNIGTETELAARIKLGPASRQIQDSQHRQLMKYRNRRNLGLEYLESRQLLTVVPELIADIRTGQQDAKVGYDMRAFNGALYFSADDGIRGSELWKTDGTAAGTVLLKDINVGSDRDSSSPGWFTEYAGALVFSAVGADGDELWKTDGTADGTVMIRDINPGEDSSSPSDLVVFQDEIYFSASDRPDNTELWKSDGTRNGTVLVKDIRTGDHSSDPGNYSGFFEFDGDLYFNARDNTTGVELWRSDGTPDGTELVLDADPDGSSWPTNFVRFRGDLYFTAEVFSSEFDTFLTHLFRVNGDTKQAELAFEMPIDLLEGVLVVGDQMYFSGLSEDFGFEPHRTDGTTTTLLRDIMPGNRDSTPRNFFEHNGKVYFAAGDSRDPESEKLIYNLWVTDGSLLGTKKVSFEQINPANQLVAYRDDVYFTALSDEFGWELFKTDGTLAGTSMVDDIAAGPNDSFPIAKRVFEDQLLFLATDSANGYEIRSYDGQQVELVNVHLGGGGFTDDPASFRFVEFGPHLVFYGSSLFDGKELFIIRGTGAEPLAGDANRDGEVDFADFLILADNFGREGAVWDDGDFDSDARVSFSDFLILADNFGRQTAAASVSEQPSSDARIVGLPPASSAADVFAEGDEESDFLL